MQGFCLSRWVAAFPQTGCGGREPRVPCQTRSFRGACGHHLHGGDEQAGGRSSPGLVRETAGRTPGRLGRGRREREREREHPGLEPTRGGRTGVAMRRRGPGGRGAPRARTPGGHADTVAGRATHRTSPPACGHSPPRPWPPARPPFPPLAPLSLCSLCRASSPGGGSRENSHVYLQVSRSSPRMLPSTLSHQRHIE